MNICLFSNEEIKNPLNLNDERAVHILKILHKKEGDFFNAGIIDGKSGKAKITLIDKDSIHFEFIEEDEGKLLFPLKMIVGFPRPIQLKRLLRDVAALGTEEIHLTGTELGEKSYMQSNLVQKGSAYKMLLDGTVQAGSTHVPKLFLHKNLCECISSVNGELKIAFDNKNPDFSIREVLNQNKNASSVIAAIGSERGWTENERNLLKSKGFFLAEMGNRIMRTETAATVAGSIILFFKGWI